MAAREIPARRNNNLVKKNPIARPARPTPETETRSRFMKNLLLVCTAFALSPLVGAESIAGLWNATINVNGTEIPFKIEFSGDGTNIKGWFFNGKQHENSTGGRFENGSLILNFDSYA